MIKDCIKKFNKEHRYFITPECWNRFGVMYKRYGEETIMEAISDIPEDSIPLTKILNIIEKRCQYIVENGELDDLAKELLS